MSENGENWNLNVTTATDPRVLKQLLMAQWINNANPLDPSAGTANGGIFETLLGGLMGTSSTDLSSSPLSYMNSVSGGYGLSLNSLGSLGSLGLYGTFGSYGSLGSLGSLFSGMMTGTGGSDSDYGGSSAAYEGLIQAAAAKYGLDPALVKGVIRTESGFQAGALSHAGAKGLMQLMDDTARGLGVQDVWDPAQNIDGGTRFLSYLLRKYDGNVSTALAAYNAGPGRVDRLGLVNDRLIGERFGELPEETQNYIRKVLTAARQYGMQI
ncbi:lytic transglycosylase domain-containing protein [Cohnella caldifontis]|uniref:lytic transglycosylase domain-containing protein n=1 Tax=Cohnella caldifontis TaxID=3027471 RepID=UPI0023EBB0AA|nr:lytic transglycosylase domain-containing protein [Cohnella sp. YIM B05605]